MPILEISVIPIGTSSASIGDMVTQACQIVKNKGLEHEITATSTLVEGDFNQLIQVAQEMHAIPFKAGAQRVITSMTIDERHDKNDSMDDKVEEVIDRM
ncbi:MTH1187 family thiamine-binding protein [Petroclostridium sp. X23]|uniref:MTH1187 family thiamine-binding protein n=1 Tax=Petroclostridium sp. X23 TaxID=3045146 RepID=UPI0024ADC149|nr:MTH1187 family thiamine-binding protein [Petroclostridium sp. X23]WHH57095.1 MTH1187 family thiamine-binding protein [Petroclostridium sp. X23]